MKVTITAGARVFIGIAFILSLLGGGISTAQADLPTDLFISEYIEGSSFNKAIEIFNGTGSSVDLGAGLYTLELYSNGAAAPSQTVSLTGTIANGDVYVLAHGNADALILAQADLISSSVINFNGDDAIVLRKNGSVIDAFGQIGVDPGTQWTGGGADDTIRRKSSICSGDTNASDAFDVSVEWDVFPINTFDGLGSHIANCAPASLEPKINEFSASTAGPDVEYVEIFGSPGADYAAYTVLEIEGDGFGAGVVDHVIPLGTTDANGFYLVSLTNGDLGDGSLTLLLVKDFTGALNNDLDTNNDGVFDVTPWSAIVDSVAVNDGDATDRTYSPATLTPNYDGLSIYAPGGASRIPDGVDTDTAADWMRNDFDLYGIPGNTGTPIVGEAVNTPGATNQAYEAPPEACGDPFTAIYDVQGSGVVSPLVSTEVAVEGVVVGDFQNNASADNGDLNGFHLQDPSGDGDPATSDGVFIYYPGGATDVAVGDRVRVRGTVSEYNGMTEITVAQIWQCSTGNALPDPASLILPVGNLVDYEKYEGMLVKFPQALTISEYFNYDRYGEIILTQYRHMTPTAIHEPGTPEIADSVAKYFLGRITLDDGRTVQNPDPAIHPNGLEFTLSNLFRGGDLLVNVTGVLDYSFGLYRIQPTTGAFYINSNPRPPDPPDVGGSLRVVSANVLNYFSTLDTGAPICGPLANLGCRGANTAEEFTRQRDKTIAAIVAMNPDIAGLVEIENHPTDAALMDLVSGLNAVAGAGTYDYIHTGPIGSDAIKVALIYKPATVSPVGAYAILDSSVDPLFLDDYNRPVLAQTFISSATGGVFTVAVNHLKSKGSDCIAVGDPDMLDGQGNCNQTRLRAAQAEVRWLATDPTGSNDTDFLIIGDLNAYDKEDPIDALKAGADDNPGTSDDFVDLLFSYQGEYAYSYVFDGQIGYLDYAIASRSLADQITDAVPWHVNADEPDLIDYDMTFKKIAQDALYADDFYRFSDHDPILVGMNLLKTAGAKAKEAAKEAVTAAAEKATETPTTLPATGFAPGRVTALPQQAVEYSELGDLWLEIPALGVKTAITGVPISNGSWDVTWLGSKVGWLEGSAFPTASGNAVLTGHVWDALNRPGVFEKLSDLRYGDQVIVHNAGKAYIYQVRERLQVSAARVNQLLKHKDRPWVTLVTCRGYDEKSGEYVSRVLVRAVLVDVK